MPYLDPTEYEGDPFEDFTLTPQQQHDVMLYRRKGKLQPGSKGRLQKLLKSKETAFDPIAIAVAHNPGLTRERAEEMARNLGF